MSKRAHVIRPADDTEQGSFCDTYSEIHYDNLSAIEAAQSNVEAQSRGDEIWEEPSFEPEERYNRTRFDIDAEGNPYPAREEPGR
ncbi:MAG: hypothetical protein F6K19_47000 [Cyanothece sp. SIO1E1]|nr:hypothetical protein [Cyanothece sp. SIO1E1]